MTRGEIWWGALPPPAGRRPVLLLSRDEAYAVRNLVVGSPVTTRIRGLPTEVRLGPEDGLPRASVVNLDVIVTVSKGRLRRRIATLTSDKMGAVETAIHFALGLDE